MAGTIISIDPADGSSVNINEDVIITITADAAFDYAALNGTTVLVSNGIAQPNVTLSNSGKTLSYTRAGYFFSEGQNNLSIWFNTSSSGANSSYEWTYIGVTYTECRAPTAPTLDTTLSREPVRLSWGAGSGGTNNAVTGYDVQRRTSTDGSSWGSWEDVPDSPVTATNLDVTPPGTAGNYYQYQVRTRGSVGSNYYSGWVTSTNTLRRKWDAFGAWTDDPLVAGETPIKALHMQELQSRVNTIYAFYGLGTYNFTTITAGATSLAGWTTHVNQIRTAIEEVCSASGKTHEDWISFSVNCPRADIIQQLRNVILAL